ncbi:MAG: SGNH/GDSL hydrolase N-terminal domain-containing protein, partial [Oscillospiraceae bacterium]
MSCQINSADKNMSRKNISEPDGIKWIFPFEFPIRLSGFAFYGIDKIYRRLPMSSKELFKKVNDCLNFLSDNTSGGQLAFRTNSTKISVKVKLKLAHNMVNMAAT